MLTQLFPTINDNQLIKLIKKGINSIWMMILIILFAAISNLFGMELFAYYSYMIIAIATILFNEDMLPTIPIVCIGYMTFSKENNPLAKEQTSIFLTNSVIIQFAIIAILIAIFVSARLIFDLVRYKERRKMPKLLYGYIALGIAYILGGLFSPYYSFKSALFGLIQIISISFFYFF